MKKLVESTFVTLDGVISDPHVWGQPYWGAEHDAYGERLLNDADALLLGRLTYEGFAAAWPQREGPYAARINSLPKHVASRTLTETSWNAEVIHGDLVEEVSRLKNGEGGNLLKFGTGEVDHVLFSNELIDELHLWVYPVFAGKGHHVAEGIDMTHCDLLDVTTLGSGIVIHVLRPKGSGPGSGRTELWRTKSSG
jgi:dihydrofolate reductase